MAEYYAQRASAGLIVAEATQISRQGQGYSFTPGIHAAAQVDGWRMVTQAVHRAGGRILLQLWHVGRMSHGSFHADGQTVAPSPVAPGAQVWVADGPSGEGRMIDCPVPRALDVDEIRAIVDDYRRAALNARRAGFDGVEIHAANGYLIDQFLRDGSNRRSDRYGGSVANRIRFLQEVADAVVGAWGADRVGVRFSPFGSFNDMADSDPVATFSAAAAAMGELKLAYLHMVEGDGKPATADQLAGIRAIRGRFDGFYVACGGYDRASALSAVASGHADAVAFATLYIGNPDLVARLRSGAALAEADRATFYQGGAKGYVDYPELAAAA